MDREEYGVGSLATLLIDLCTSGDYQPDKPKVEFISYKEYLKTEHWQAVKKQALSHYKYQCGLNSNHRHHLNVHHKNYDHMWAETMDDVIVLCSDCHHIHHGNLPKTPPEIYHVRF